jgi:amino acid transporter
MFVRQSSGLVREFSITDVVTINVAGVNLGIVAALTIGALAGLWPGASMVLLVVFGALVSLATVGTYGLMSATMPRSGGDYVFVGRSLTPWLGFLANWMITWSLFVLLGLFSVGIVTQALAPAMAAFGYVADAPGLVGSATDLTEDQTLLAVLAIAFMACAGAIALAGDRWVKRAFRSLTVVGVGGLLVALVVLLTTSSDEFAERMNAILAVDGATTIDGMRQAAVDAGFTPTDFSLSATLSALPYAFFAFVGLTYTSYLGGEIQRPQRSQPLGMLIALGTCLLFYVVFFAGVYRTFGWDDIHAWAFLAGENPDAIGFFGGAPLGTFLLGGLSTSPVVSLVIGVSFVAWFFMILLFAIVLPVRNLFAWSLDRVLPESVSRVSARGTPWVATLIVAVLAVGAAVVAVFSDFITLTVNYTLFYSTTFLLAGIAAAAFPYRRPDLLELAPRTARRRIAGIPLLTIAGTVQTIVFAVIIVEALRNPAFGGPAGRGTLMFIGALIVMAPAVFLASRAVRKRQGYDVDAAWRGLPPD